MRTMRMEREDIENSLKVLSHIVDDDFIITVDEARKIIRIDGETIVALQAKIERLQAQLPKRGEWELIDGAEPMRWGCSRCKYLSWETSNYCPRCGAKMEVQDGDEKGT